MIPGRWMWLLIGAFAAMAGAQFVAGEWSIGSVWISATVWAGVAHNAMRYGEAQRDAMNMLRELAQLEYGSYARIELISETHQPAGTTVVGKFRGAM